MKALAQGRAVCSDNAHCRATLEGVEELDELLRDLHVAQEESLRAIWRVVKGLVDIKGQDVIRLLTSLKPMLRQEYRAGYRTARHGLDLGVCGHPLANHDRREPPHEGGHEHSHVLLPQRYGPVCVLVPRGRYLPRQPDYGLIPQSRDFRASYVYSDLVGYQTSDIMKPPIAI